jgi:hypothetical protein
LLADFSSTATAFDKSALQRLCHRLDCVNAFTDAVGASPGRKLLGGFAEVSASAMKLGSGNVGK